MSKSKKQINRRGKLITKDRAMQIVNNVFEDYLDHADTSFATATELCETIMQMDGFHRSQLQRKDEALDSIIMRAVRGRSYITDKEAKELGMIDPDLDSR